MMVDVQRRIARMCFLEIENCCIRGGVWRGGVCVPVCLPVCVCV